MDHGRSKHAVGGNAQRPVKRQPNRSADLEGLTRKSPRQSHGSAAQNGHGPTCLELREVLGFYGIGRQDPPHRHRQSGGKTKAGRFAQEAQTDGESVQ